VCFSDIDALLCNYATYKPLWVATSRHCVGGVFSQFKPVGWRDMLSGGPNKVYGDHWDVNSLFILDGVMHGFKIIDPYAKVIEYESENYKSATVDAYDFINDIIINEIDSGKLSVIDRKPHCIHALGAVEKSSGGFRPITDASKPDWFSINNYMSETFQHFTFCSMDDICDSLSPGSFLGVTDISAAYRSVLIRMCDRKYQGLKWNVGNKEVYVQDNFLSFGARASPYIFNSLTDAVTRYMNSCGFKCFNYLDDFLVIGDSFSSCQEAQLALHSLLRSLGFDIAYKKVRSPSKVQRYLGIDIDTIQMKLLLPADKVDKLHEELAFFAGRRQATRKQLQRLCGILSHCSTVIRGGRTFSHRIVGLLSNFSPTKRRITLSKTFFADLDWWRNFSYWFNGEAKMVGRRVSDQLVISMDASGSGFGVVAGNDWIAGCWKKDLDSNMDKHSHFSHTPDTEIPDNINVQELYPLVEALWRWGPQWRNCKILCMSDNTQVVTGINSGKSDNLIAMSLLRRIFWLCVLHNCHVVSMHIPGKLNIEADALSRLLDDKAQVPLGFCCRCRPTSSDPRP
jgi:hypothetical protein